VQRSSNSLSEQLLAEIYEHMDINVKAKGSLKIAVLIPARYNSSRFPGKALCKLKGVPMARVVYERCIKAGFDTFLVSDDERICALVANSILTSAECENGTARCAEAAAKLTGYDAFINVQGDMPDITSEIIHAIAKLLDEAGLVTAYTKMSESERSNPNSVKLIHNRSEAIWMCRAPLKYGDQHIGIYGYHKEILAAYANLPDCLAEREEGLEQLRWLNCRYTMKVTSVTFTGVEINAPADVERWEEMRT